MVDTFATFERKTARFQSRLTDKALTNRIGQMAKTEARATAVADLGADAKFRNWAPVLEVRYVHIEPGKIGLRPRTRRAAGGWTLAEYGRGNAPTSKRRRGRRYTGKTKGMRTATKATDRIAAKVPIMVRQHVGAALRETFR